MATLTEFVSARLDKDEAAVRKYHEVSVEHCPADCWEFERVILALDAMRRIVALHSEGSNEGDCRTCATTQWNGSPQAWVLRPCATIRALATIWREHPDFDPAWD